MLEDLKAMASSIHRQFEETQRQMDILDSLIHSIEKNQDDQWVSTSIAAEKIGRPARTIRQAAEDKRIRSRRRGSRNLEVNLADCNKFFNAV